MTTGGKIFTSARILLPWISGDIKDHSASVKVGGSLVALTTVKDPEATDKDKARDLVYDGTLEGKIEYARTLAIDSKGVSIETTLSGDGKDVAAELYETFPVFLRDPGIDGKDTPNTTIEFQTGGNWAPATDAFTQGVKAVRITRYTGAVAITFDKPRRVKLSPAEWKDVFLSAANCRNVMVDMLENDDKPAPVKDAKKFGYRIEPVAK